MEAATYSFGIHVLALFFVALPICGYILWMMIGPAIRD